MKGPLAEMMKQAQQMQRKMEEAQEKLAASEVTGESGGGMVKVVMTGRNDVRGVNIADKMALDIRRVLLKRLRHHHRPQIRAPNPNIHLHVHTKQLKIRAPNPNTHLHVNTKKI